MRGAKKTTKPKAVKAKASKTKKIKAKTSKAKSRTVKPKKKSKEMSIISKLIMDDRRVKLPEIAIKAECTEEEALRILTEECECRQLHGQWVSNSIHPFETYDRVNACEKMLIQLKRDRIAFLRRFVTVDEFSIYHEYPNEVTEQPESGVTSSKKVKATTKSTSTDVKKVRVIVFWDAFGVILLDSLKKNQKKTPEYYSKLLHRLGEEMKTKRPKLGKMKVLLQQNDSIFDYSVDLHATLSKLNFELVPHSKGWPDLAPTSYHLVPNVEKAFAGRKFSTDKAAIDGLRTYFENLDEDSFKDGITELEQRWNKCIQARGNFFE